MNSVFDVHHQIADILLPFKIGLGILLGYMLRDWFDDRFPPDPDAFA